MGDCWWVYYLGFSHAGQWGEGHSAAGWGIGGSVIAADCGVQSQFVRPMGCRYLRCAT